MKYSDAKAKLLVNTLLKAERAYAIDLKLGGAETAEKSRTRVEIAIRDLLNALTGVFHNNDGSIHIPELRVVSDNPGIENPYENMIAWLRDWNFGFGSDDFPASSYATKPTVKAKLDVNANEFVLKWPRVEHTTVMDVDTISHSIDNWPKGRIKSVVITWE